MPTVHILGSGEHKDLIEYGLEGFGYAPGTLKEAGIVVAVGDAEIPALETRQYLIRILEPDQEIDRSELTRPQQEWMVPTELDARRLVSLAAAVGESVDVTVLVWSSPVYIARTCEPLPKLVRIYCGHGSLQIPITFAVMTEDETRADILIAPESLPQLLAAQHRGIPAIVEEGTPLAEYIQPGVNGLVKPREDFNEVLATLLQQNARLIRAMTVPQPGMYRARRHAFVRALEKAVTGKRLSVVFAHGQKPGIKPWQKKQPQGARGMRYQALVAFGADVRHVPDLSQLAAVRHDFILLGGRIQPARVRAVAQATKAPIIMCMNDAIIDVPGRTVVITWSNGTSRCFAL